MVMHRIRSPCITYLQPHNHTTTNECCCVPIDLSTETKKNVWSQIKLATNQAMATSGLRGVHYLAPSTFQAGSQSRVLCNVIEPMQNLRRPGSHLTNISARRRRGGYKRAGRGEFRKRRRRWVRRDSGVRRLFTLLAPAERLTGWPIRGNVRKYSRSRRFFLAAQLLLAAFLYMSPSRWFVTANHVTGDMYSEEAITSGVAKKNHRDRDENHQ